jgi:hypothetical protein
MVAKCAIFDATHTIPAFSRNATEKMKIFEANNQICDIENEKQAQKGQKARSKGRKIRDFAEAGECRNFRVRVWFLTRYDRIQ